MDDTMQPLHDAVVEDELARGYRIKAVPPRIKKLLDYAQQENPTIIVWNRIRFERLTPRARSLVGEAVAMRYSADLRSNQYLTYAELRKMNIERGAWSDEEDAQMKELQLAVTAEMQSLYLDGFDKHQQWSTELATLCTEYNEAVAGSEQPDDVKTKAIEVFDRWLNFTKTKQEEYTLKYAESQGSDTYKVDKDFLWLMEIAPTDDVAEKFNTIDELKIKLYRLMEIMEKRQKLDQIVEKRAKIFGTSIESRQERTLEMAQIYYGTKLLGEGDKPTGRLTPEFDGIWDLPDGVVDWVLTEAHCFYEGIPDVVREYFEAWGFLRAEQDTGSPQVSDESPVPPTSKNDSQLVTTTPASSFMSSPAKS